MCSSQSLPYHNIGNAVSPNKLKCKKIYKNGARLKTTESHFHVPHSSLIMLLQLAPLGDRAGALPPPGAPAMTSGPARPS